MMTTTNSGPGFGMGLATADLGLGGPMSKQALGESEEERRKRLLLQQQRTIGPAAMSLGLGDGLG